MPNLNFDSITSVFREHLGRLIQQCAQVENKKDYIRDISDSTFYHFMAGGSIGNGKIISDWSTQYTGFKSKWEVLYLFALKDGQQFVMPATYLDYCFKGTWGRTAESLSKERLELIENFILFEEANRFDLIPEEMRNEEVKKLIQNAQLADQVMDAVITDKDIKTEINKLPQDIVLLNVISERISIKKAYINIDQDFSKPKKTISILNKALEELTNLKTQIIETDLKKQKSEELQALQNKLVTINFSDEAQTKLLSDQDMTKLSDQDENILRKNNNDLLLSRDYLPQVVHNNINKVYRLALKYGFNFSYKTNCWKNLKEGVVTLQQLTDIFLYEKADKYQLVPQEILNYEAVQSLKQDMELADRLLEQNNIKDPDIITQFITDNNINTSSLNNIYINVLLLNKNR